MKWFVNMFLHCHKICKNLCWVKFVCQSVPYWYARVFSQSFNCCLSITTIFNTVIYSSQNSCSVFHRLFLTHLRTCRSKVSYICSFVHCTHFKRTTSSC